MKRILALVATALIFTTGCLPEMANWGWWKAREPTVRQTVTVDMRTNFGFYWPDALNAINNLAGWPVLGPAGWYGVWDQNADVLFQQSGPICPYGDWPTCTERRHMWVQWVVPDPNAPFLSRCIVWWDPAYWVPSDPGWQAHYWHWQVIMHEVMHCLGYPDVLPPTDYVGALSYYGFWDPAYRAANWWTWGGHDWQLLDRDSYGLY